MLICSSSPLTLNFVLTASWRGWLDEQRGLPWRVLWLSEGLNPSLPGPAQCSITIPFLLHMHAEASKNIQQSISG